MKRQLGAMSIAAMLLCASTAWSQSSGTSSSQPGLSSSSSQILFTDSSPGASPDSGQNGAGDSSQSGSDNTQTGANGPQDTFTHPEQLPGLDAFSEVVSHTGLSLNTSVGSQAQRVAYSGYPGYWQNLSSVGAGINLTQIRPGFSVLLGYNGGLNVTTGGEAYNYTNLNQNAIANITWNFAKRWQMRVKENYFYSDDPFQPFFTYLGNPTPNQPNPVTYYPNAVIEQNQAELDLTYQLSPHDLINFSGVEGFNRYERQEITTLYDSVNYSGSAFYQHQFNARLASGGGYSIGSLDFGHGQSRAGVQTFEGFISYVFSSKVQASLWIGPELTHTKDIVPVFCNEFGCFIQEFHMSSWSVAEGGTFDWRLSSLDKFSAQVSRGVSSAGGFLGAAYIYQVTGTYGRALSRAWNLGAGVQYNRSDSVSMFRSDQYLHSITGTIGVNRKIFNDAWTINAYYAFIHQTQNYTGLPATVGTNGFGFTLRYIWSHPLGG